MAAANNPATTLPSLQEQNFVHPDSLGARLAEISAGTNIRVEEIGRSRSGRPILGVHVGDGQRDIACVAGAHCDEPVGTLTILELIRYLSSEQGEPLRSAWQFHFIPQLDPDGAVLNWRWMSRPFSFLRFAKWSYRSNNPAEDIEHGIPLSPSQETLPEVQAFFRFSQAIKNLHYYVTLHTTHVAGGATFLLRAKEPSQEKSLVGKVKAICDQERIPLWDMDLRGRKGIRKILPGFHTPPLIQDLEKHYASQESILQKLRMTTYQYATDVLGAPVALITEIPSIYIPEMNDVEETCIDLGDLERESLRRSQNILADLKQEWISLSRFPMTEENRIWATYYSNLIKIETAKLAAAEKFLTPSQELRATAAEVHELAVDRDESRFKRGLMGYRRLQGVAGDEASTMRRDYARQFVQAFGSYEKRRPYTLIPVAQQVHLQVSVVLAGCELFADA